MHSRNRDEFHEEFMLPLKPLSELPCAESDSDQSEDSDAEFLVHPILRSLIKSKSAYTMPKETPRLKTSKTAFEINLSKMWESTVDDEAPVANFTPDLDQKWPEPDAPSPPVKLYFPPYIIPRSPLRPRNSCCSAPFNVHKYRSASNSPIEHLSSWSAPEYLNDSESDYDDDPEEDHVTRSCSCQGPDHDVTERKTSFLNSYPVIDSAQQVPSLCSIRLPSSSGTTTDSLSPPRPLSPVLGRPPVSANRISGSRSMQLRPRPELSSFVDNSTSDDDSPQQDPWPQQEVWPEEDVMSRSLRTGWTAAEPVTQVQRPQSSRTGFGDARHVRVSGSRSMHNQIQYAPSQLESSTRPRLDEAERRDLITRRAWIDRGSTVQLQDSAAERKAAPQVAETSGLNIGTRCESQSDYRSDSEPADFMKRSYTTEELKRERRRLPKRPDVQPFLSELPSSLPLHGQTVDDLGEPRQQSDFSVRGEGDVHYYCQAASPAPQRRPSKVTGGQRRHVTSEDFEPPTPVNVNPSPPSQTGRRLPLLPISLVGHYPTMSLPTHQGASKPQDHTLCFIDGMTDSMLGRSAFEDSYYEEDGLNGNHHVKQRKSFFSPDDSSGVSSCTTSDSLNPTHRVQSAFIPRHSDEVLLDIGDAVHVDRTCEDHWCYGTNLRTGMTGIFPSAVVCEIDIVEEICMGALPSNASKVTESERDTFYLTMLASIEVGHHKGNDVLVQAMNKVLSMYKNHEEIIVPQTVLMEVSFRGIHVIDKRRKNFFQCPTFDFFYSLQNISFCGAHPKQLKYFGFITKHPLLPRFACHVFLSSSSTQPIVESIGRAFKRSYDEYMAFAHPTEDIYLE